MNKNKTFFLVFALCIIVSVPIYFLFFHSKNTKQLSVLELGQSARWTPESYEPYKLDKKAVTGILTKEAKYVEKVSASKDLLQLKKSIKRGENVDFSKYGSQFKSFGLKQDDFVAPINNSINDETTTQDKPKSVLGATDLNIPQIGTRDVPSIAGGNVNKYTGSVSHSYAIQMPPIRGNAGVGVAFNYSSRTIDDLRTNKMGYSDVSPEFQNGSGDCDGYDCEFWDKNIDSHTDSTTGLGWSLSSFGSITIDSDYDNEYVLSVSGQNVRIKQEINPETGGVKFFTYPDNKFLIERYGKWGAWKVTDTSGNVYFFGSIDEQLTGTNNKIPRNSANEYMADGMLGDDANRTPFCSNDKVSRWNLSRISDIHGNTVEVEYSQKIDSVIAGCDQSLLATPIEVKYNYNEEEGKYLNRIVLQYIDYDSKNVWDTNSNPTESIFLGKVIVYGGESVLGEYHFGYTKSFSNPKWVGGQTRRLLLTSIAKKGFEGKGEQRPTTFCYKSLKDSNNPEVCNGTDVSQLVANYTPNDIYMVSFDNGYGGKVSYNYEKIANIDKICSVKEDNIKTCGDIITPPALKSGFNQPGKYLASYYRVANVIASNGLGQEKKTEYKYDGSSVAYASEVVRVGGIPGTGQAILTLEGLQFLGYPQVQLKVSDASDGKVLSHVRSYTYQFNENDSCVMVDPRYGSEYKNEILDQGGNAIGFTDNTIIVRKGNDCIGDPKKWGEKEVYSKGVYSELDGKKSKQENFYDFEIYGEKPDQYGNVVKSVNYGNPDNTGDEVYSYSLFLTPERFGSYQKEGLVPNSLKFSDYLAKNLISLVAGSFVTAENYDKPEDAPERKRLNNTRMLYDQRLDDWQHQDGISGVRGLLSQTQQIYYGKSADDKDSKNILNSYVEYNKYGLQIKSTSADGQKSYVFYDDVLHSIPTCVVNVSSEFKDSDKKSQDELCNISKDKGKKVVQKLSFENREQLLRQLPNYSEDPNGARTTYKFDEYGRVTQVYSPNPVKSNESLDFASQTAFYYDNLTPMRTRTQVATKLPDGKEITKVSDAFMDGFGNPSQNITYKNFDKDGEFAVVSYQEFNGIGQVTSKVTNIPVREKDLKLENQPKLVEKSLLDKNKSLANVEQTTYDYFSRPTEVKVTVGGESGNPVIKTIKTSYEAYQVIATDAVNNQVKRVMDGLGREIKTVNYLCLNTDNNCNAGNGKPIEINTKFDILGNALEIKDPKGFVIKSAIYNTASMPLQVNDSDRGVSKIFYDDLGRNQKAINARGIIVENLYDGFGRVISSNIINGKNVVRKTINEYDTDKIGALYKTTLMAMFPDGKTKLVQEVTSNANYLGAVVKSQIKTLDVNTLNSNPLYITKVDTNTYTDTGLLVNFKSKLEGASDYLDDITYDYKEDLKLKSVVDNTKLDNKLLLNNITNDYKGQVLGYTLGNNLMNVSQSFDNQSRLTEKYTTNAKDASLIDKLIYKYNASSNISQTIQTDDPAKQNSTQTKNYTYDSFSRLKEVTGATSERFVISDVGALNLKKEDYDVISSTFVSDAIKTCETVPGYDPKVNGCPYHAMLMSTKNRQDTYYLYDKNGNLVKETYPDGKYKIYTYGVLDLPVEIADYDSNQKLLNSTKFIYGLGGQRIGKIGRTIETPTAKLPITAKPALVVATPIITPSAIVAVGSVTVKATTTTAKAVIRYTDNGTSVTASSPIMPSTGIVITASNIIVKKTIKVKAFLTGYNDSAEVSKTYSVSPKVTVPVSKTAPVVSPTR